jgi:hypothetical protein
MSSFDIIRDSILASLRANGLAVVSAADTSWASDEKNERFAHDVAANAAMALTAEDDDERTAADEGQMWTAVQP